MSYKFLDHTADMRIHAKGKDLQEAFQYAALGFYAILTELKAIKPIIEKTISIESEDYEALLYDWIDNLLFIFDTELFISNQIKINKLTKISSEKFVLEAVLMGEKFSIKKHPRYREIKAMTYSFMKIGKNYVEFTLDL